MKVKMTLFVILLLTIVSCSKEQPIVSDPLPIEIIEVQPKIPARNLEIAKPDITILFNDEYIQVDNIDNDGDYWLTAIWQGTKLELFYWVAEKRFDVYTNGGWIDWEQYKEINNNPNFIEGKYK